MFKTRTHRESDSTRKKKQLSMFNMHTAPQRERSDPQKVHCQCSTRARHHSKSDPDPPKVRNGFTFVLKWSSEIGTVPHGHSFSSRADFSKIDTFLAQNLLSASQPLSLKTVRNEYFRHIYIYVLSHTRRLWRGCVQRHGKTACTGTPAINRYLPVVEQRLFALF